VPDEDIGKSRTDRQLKSGRCRGTPRLEDPRAPSSMTRFLDDAEMRRNPNDLKDSLGSDLKILAGLTMDYSHAACPSLY
jgi:hypothetical protein